MQEFGRTAKRAAITAAIGLAVAMSTAVPAAASPQGPILVYKGTFPTKSACHTAGIADRNETGLPYQCAANNGKWDLYWVYN